VTAMDFSVVSAHRVSSCRLRDNPHPTDEEIREGLSGNFCRCTGYQGIINAVHQAAETGVAQG
jgi:aerobic-type carbon monoxide dehydrogenase small subunit (CoxS/CutS family)